MRNCNSIESYEKCLREKWHTLTGKIFATFEAASIPLTDREVCQRNGWADMNIARPKINGLIERRVLVKVDDVLDQGTDRYVRRCDLSSRHPEILNAVVQGQGDLFPEYK